MPAETAVCGDTKTKMAESLLPLILPAAAAQMAKAAGTFQQQKFNQQQKRMEGCHHVPIRSSRSQVG